MDGIHINESSDGNNNSTKSSEKLSINNRIISNISNQKIDYIKLQKMTFIYNAIQKGWSIRKIGRKYIFTKKHNNKKEYLYDSYLKEFIESNIEPTANTETTSSLESNIT